MSGIFFMLPNEILDNLKFGEEFVIVESEILLVEKKFFQASWFGKTCSLINTYKKTNAYHLTASIGESRWQIRKAG